MYESNSGHDIIRDLNPREDAITIYTQSRKQVRELENNLRLICRSQSSKQDLRIVSDGVSIRLPGLTESDTAA